MDSELAARLIVRRKNEKDRREQDRGQPHRGIRGSSMLRSLLAILFAACCSGSNNGDGSTERIPEALRPLARQNEVSPFTGFTIPNVRLWVVSARDVPADGSSSP